MESSRLALDLATGAGFLGPLWVHALQIHSVGVYAPYARPLKMLIFLLRLCQVYTFGLLKITVSAVRFRPGPPGLTGLRGRFWVPLWVHAAENQAPNSRDPIRSAASRLRASLTLDGVVRGGAVLPPEVRPESSLWGRGWGALRVAVPVGERCSP